MCLFEAIEPKLTSALIDVAWRNYFGSSHAFAPEFSERFDEAGRLSLEM
jgi:hypothetical protein